MSFIEVVPSIEAGPYAYLNACLKIEDGRRGRSTTLADLADPGCLAGIVAQYTATMPGADRRALGSMWWQYFVSFLVPPALMLRLGGASLRPAADRVSADFGPDGLVRGFRIALDRGSPGPHDAWLGTVLADLCAPVVAGLKEATGVAPRVLWSNTASRLHTVCVWRATRDIEAGRMLAFWRARRWVPAATRFMAPPGPGGRSPAACATACRAFAPAAIVRSRPAARTPAPPVPERRGSLDALRDSS